MKAQSKPSSASSKLNTNAGGAGPGRVRRSPARQGRRGWAGPGRGEARCGMAGSARLGEVWNGGVRRSTAG